MRYVTSGDNFALSAGQLSGHEHSRQFPQALWDDISRKVEPSPRLQTKLNEILIV